MALSIGEGVEDLMILSMISVVDSSVDLGTSRNLRTAIKCACSLIPLTRSSLEKA